jgi:hypothetical protein
MPFSVKGWDNRRRKTSSYGALANALTAGLGLTLVAHITADQALVAILVMDAWLTRAAGGSTVLRPSITDARLGTCIVAAMAENIGLYGIVGSARLNEREAEREAAKGPSEQRQHGYDPGLHDGSSFPLSPVRARREREFL